MNEVAADDAEPSPAFLQAVVDLGATQTVTTSQAIFNTQGVKLLEGGAKVDQGLYDRLVSHRLSRPLDECVRAEPSVDGKLLREAAQAAMERWPFFAQLAPTAVARESLLRLIAALPLPKPIALHLDLARNSRPGLFTHSILMALLCAYLAGQSEGSTRDDVADAAAAGLLHDMGMLHIDPALLDADERLSGNRLNPVYVHPLTSSMLIDRFDAYPKPVARAVVEHHERLDGSGYPRGLRRRGDQPARPDRRPGRSGDGDVRRRAGAAGAAGLAAAAHQPAPLRPGACRRRASPARGAAGERGRQRRHARAVDRPAAAPGRRARALAPDQRGDQSRLSTGPMRRCSAR